MDARTKRSLLWGVVGLLAFLVLVQGYELLAGEGVTLVAKAGTALVVGVTATLSTYWAAAKLSGTPPE